MRKNILSLLFIFTSIIMPCAELFSQEPVKQQTTKDNSDIMTPELLWSMGRIGEYAVSPDGLRVVYSVSHYSIEQNKGRSALYISDIDGNNLQVISPEGISEYSPAWRPDGLKIGFLCAASGSMQLWEMNADGSDRRQVTEIDGGITGFKYSPTMSHIAITMEVDKKQSVKDIYPDLPLSSGRVNNDLMYRHWDQWVDSYGHIFIADYDDSRIGTPVDIMEGELWEAPLRPFGGVEQIEWTPDGKSLIYCSRKLTGKAYALSTNSDLYLYDLGSGKTSNLTEGMMGYDLNPVVSPDGTMVAWESMEHDGYESDKQRLFVMNLVTRERRNYSQDFDQNTNALQWSADGKYIFFVSDRHATEQLYELRLKDGKIRKITEGKHNYLSVQQAGKHLLAARQSMSRPTELYLVSRKDGEAQAITHVNDDIFAQLTMGDVEERWVETTDGKQMLVWVIYPPHFDKDKQYPALLYCEGGPQSTVSQFWSFRWNFQMMAANDYIIVAPNRRGLPGFGQEWLEAISGDYGGQCMKDYLTAIDKVSEEPFIDKERLGAVGASFGGFSVYWLAGHHEGRFKALIAHDGMFNLEAQYLETEEMWFANWDLGGPFWDKDNATAARTYSNSPHHFVDKWTAPILVIHGEQDFRIAFTQGMQAYNAAILRGIPAEFLFFPDENHWVLKPQNGILWQRRFFNWLDTYLK